MTNRERCTTGEHPDEQILLEQREQTLGLLYELVDLWLELANRQWIVNDIRERSRRARRAVANATAIEEEIPRAEIVALERDGLMRFYELLDLLFPTELRQVQDGWAFEYDQVMHPRTVLCGLRIGLDRCGELRQRLDEVVTAVLKLHAVHHLAWEEGRDESAILELQTLDRQESCQQMILDLVDRVLGEN